ncbi:MAG: N-6 DNA methylase [Bacteroidales bacterium]|nr:N-6 DNA methylase [Bacteroidales bacterium]
MSLFQHSVIQKYLKALDVNAVNMVYTVFTSKYNDANYRQNLIQTIETSYYERFLEFIFDKILGYKIAPENNHNIILQHKTDIDTKKPDAIILASDNNPASILAVIEIKDTKKINLTDVELQAFNYKNSFKGCRYIITSNFEKLRFYIDDKVEYIEFDLFNMTPENFSLFYFCLSKETLLKNLPLQAKQDSYSQETDITKKLYSDYSVFKKLLFDNLCLYNPQYDKLTLFRKTQKLLDRFLFLFFAEDKALLPPNSVREIIRQWETLKEYDNYVPLYDRFKKYFGYLNTGFKSKQYDIFPYNGGLFLPDDILDNVKLDDRLLYEHTLKLCDYDFDTEVDVNILGHIFEHSLNEIEEIQAELQGVSFDKSKSKRKKDGVFYTPKYITKYIVDNTLGNLCNQKKDEYGINKILSSVEIITQKSKKKELLANIDAYRSWLLELKICDPACGSGAFLNQALDFLISEHKQLDELIAKITNSPLVLSDIENSVLENNIYGVDINDEAVEIAKLSLWLKTARKGRKLTDLSKNLKCGDSLIDDPAIAGDKAFNWFIEFPQVFPHYKKPDNLSVKEGTMEYFSEEQSDTVSFITHNSSLIDNNSLSEPLYSYKPESKGFKRYGFDVIICNPPYVLINPLFLLSFSFTKTNHNTYVAFTEKSLSLLKESGIIGLIIPNTWFAGYNYAFFREKLLLNFNLKQIVQLPYNIFNAYIDTSIVILNKNILNQFVETFKYNIKESTEQIDNNNNFIKFNPSDWLKFKKVFLNPDLIKIGNKVWFSDKNIKLDKIAKVNRGCLPPKTNQLSLYINDSYNLKWFDEQVFRYVITEDKQNPLFVNYDSLKENKAYNLFNCEKLLARQLINRQFRMNLTYTNEVFAFKKNLYAIYDNIPAYNLKYILSILNSKLFSYCQVNFNTSLQRDDFPAFSLNDFKEFPIPVCSLSDQRPFIEKADIMLLKNKELLHLKNNFIKILQVKFENININNKLKEWYKLRYIDFNKELEKQKIKIPLSVQSEWLQFFESEKTKVAELLTYISKTDSEIDNLVYNLYNLTDEEIKIVEKCNNRE